MTPAFRTCSTCRGPIAFGAMYYLCSVSTCNRKRTGLAFCSLACWDAHVPVLNHRDAWAEEQLAPPAPAAESAPPPPEATAARTRRPSADLEPASDTGEALVVVARLKQYIRERSGGMSTSAEVIDVLSDLLRRRCDAAIRKARRDGRKTVMARDFTDS